MVQRCFAFHAGGFNVSLAVLEGPRLLASPFRSLLQLPFQRLLLFHNMLRLQQAFGSRVCLAHVLSWLAFDLEVLGHTLAA